MTKFKNVVHFIYNLTIFRTFFNNTYEISYNLWKKIDLLFVQTITSIVCDKRVVILRPMCINTLFVLFAVFCGTQSITFSKINRETLKRYSNYLMASRLKPNTISTYMRMLRSIYNRGVDMHQAPYVHGLFRDVFTGVDTRQEESYPDRRTSHAIKQRSSIGKASSDAGHCQSVISVLWNAFFLI